MRSGGMAVRYRLGQVAVRVDDGDPLPGDDVVHRQIKQRRALARSPTCPRCRRAARAPRARDRSAPQVVRAMYACGSSICRGSHKCDLAGLRCTNVPKPGEWSAGTMPALVE